jgi:hypothetical protein
LENEIKMKEEENEKIQKQLQSFKIKLEKAEL